MNFERLILDNFLTLGHAEFDLNDRGLLLIQGENADDSSASSNGAGKSSVVDGLCWVIYGVTARGITGDDAINSTAKKDCFGSLLLNDGGIYYRIERNRKNGPKKNQLFVYRIDTAGDVDMSKGTEKETQEVINKIMGCSLEVFCASVYAGQEKMPDLPGMTDKQLKVLIEEAAGVEVLTATHQIALKAQTLAKGKLEVANTTLTAARTANEQANIRFVSVSGLQREHNDGRLARAKGKMAEAAEPLADLKTHTAELEKIDVDAVIAMRDEGNKELSDVQPMLDKQKELDAEVASLERAAAGLKGLIEANKRTLKAKKAELENMQSLIGTPCGSCGKEYCEHDLEAAVTAKKAAYNDLADQTRKLVVQLADKETGIEAAKEKAQKHCEGIPVISESRAKVERASIVLTAVAGLKSKIESAKAQVERIKAEAHAIAKDTSNPYDSMVVTAAAELERHKVDEADAEAALLAAQEELELAQAVVAVYGPAGVRAHILDTVTPFLNERTREYLGALSDGNIHATWSTLTKNAKGELKEKFQIEVTHDKGAQKFDGLSGGEKRKVRLSCALALQDMVASRASKPINIFVGDEIDHALDEPGLERLMGVLERKARDRGTVLVISHNALGDWIDQVITVRKDGGKSSVSGDNMK